MIIGVGIDMIEVDRVIEKIDKKNGFREKIFSEAEIVFCESKKNRTENYAARFAAKEALAKALGRGLRAPLLLPAITIKHHESGQPFFELDASAAHLLDAHITAHLSISDEREFAVAFVILEKP